MLNTLDQVEEYFENETHATEERVNKSISASLTGKHFVITRHRRRTHEKIYAWRYYGVITGAQVCLVANRNELFTSLWIRYTNKKGENKSISVRFDNFNDVQFFDDEASAKLFAEAKK